MKSPLVLVTRPIERTDTVITALATRGYRAHVNPLLKTIPLSATIPAGTFDAILFTSVAAVSAAAQGLDMHTPVLTVGEHTSQAALDFGFNDVRCIGQSLAQAAQWLSALFDDMKTVLHPSGVHVAGNLLVMMKGKGPRIMRVPVYDTHCLSLEKTTIALLYAGKIQTILLFSTRTAEALMMAIERLDRRDWSRGVTIGCLSARIAQATGAAEWAGTTIAHEPTEAALIAALPVPA